MKKFKFILTFLLTGVYVFATGKPSLTFNQLNAEVTDYVNNICDTASYKSLFTVHGRLRNDSEIPSDVYILNYYGLQNKVAVNKEPFIDSSHIIEMITTYDEDSGIAELLIVFDDFGKKVLDTYTSSHIGDNFVLIYEDVAVYTYLIDSHITSGILRIQDEYEFLHEMKDSVLSK